MELHKKTILEGEKNKEFINFVKTIASLGCLPQLIIALMCLVAMLGLNIWFFISLIKEIKHG